MLGANPAVSSFRILRGTYPPCAGSGSEGREVQVLYVSASRTNARIVQRILLRLFAACEKCSNEPGSDDECPDAGPDHCVYLLIDGHGHGSP